MKKETVLFIDDETFSPVDIKTRGSWNYAKKAGLITMSYRFSNWKSGRVEFVVNWEREKMTKNDFPKEVQNWRGPVVAHNLFFEHAIHSHVLPFLPHLSDPLIYRCTAATSRRMGLPGDLYSACKALGLKNLKDKAEGDKLIQKYSKPDPKTGLFRPIPPEDRKKWLTYGRGDVLAMEELYNVLPPLHLDKFEWPVFQADKKMNLRGLKMDVSFIKSLQKVYGEILNQAEAKAVKMAGRTKSGTLILNSRDNFLNWVNSRLVSVKPIENAQAGTLGKLIRDLSGTKSKMEKEVLEALAVRRIIAAKSPKKLAAMLNFADEDGIVRHAFLYNLTHTNRWAGRAFQPQNLTRDATEDFDGTFKELKKLVKAGALYKIEDGKVSTVTDLIKQLMRGCIVPRDGKKIIIADFAGVEMWTLFYLSDCQAGLRAFKENRDLYIEQAAEVYGIPMKAVDKKKRNHGKVFMLAPQYGMGDKKMYLKCDEEGIPLDKKGAKKAIDAYRERFVEVPRFWRNAENAFIQAVQNGKETKIGNRPHNTIKFKTGGFGGRKFLRMTLPNGRPLYFFNPQVKWIKKEITLDDGTKKMVDRQVIQYWGALDEGGFGLKTIWGGTLAENIASSYSRDLLCHSMLEVEAA
jgi:DNA polymerase bacteriophage-type